MQRGNVCRTMVKGGDCGWSQHAMSAKHLSWWRWQKGGLKWREYRRWGLREADRFWEEMYGEPEETRHGKRRKKPRQASPEVHRADDPKPPPPPPPGAGGGGFGGDKTAVLISLWETTLRTVMST